MKWKDSDNDLIVMSSDEELAQALANAEDGLLRVFLFCKQGVEAKPKTPEAPTGGQTNGDGVRHRLVTCDGCDKDIFGPRYKCLQCENFDLCSVCNSANKHSEHDMIKLVKPSDVPREWVFWGSRKLWRSLFGICPGRFFRNHQAGQAGSPPSSDSGEGSAKASPQGPHKHCHANRPHGFPGEAFFNAMGHEFGDAQKIFTDVVQNLANLVPGVEVEVRRDPPYAGCKAKTNEHNTGAKQPATSDATANINVDEKVTKPKERDTAQPAPKKEDPMPSPAPSKEEKVEAPVQPKSEEVKSVPVSSVETKEANNAAAKSSESREQSPNANMDTSMNTDDWTLIHDEESTKPEVATAVEAPVEPTQEVHYPKLEEVEKKPEEGNVIQTSDPKIINALIKMHAMGFTNEGGWLERLLITKHGNINEALDALYPFSQRH
ncbi:hypothetical protein JTE90_024997 [Oedothorax gibbosus]|uniref:ZZ-type domain-containing protein n=1 Tax=Oedothorax gibbosus TaxID=931172 RepID=A0AAV6VVD6_9ARAC|nr:hypothetical protein JTE90_024997 [Oedothorax gibbosus]